MAEVMFHLCVERSLGDHLNELVEHAVEVGLSFDVIGPTRLQCAAIEPDAVDTFRFELMGKRFYSHSHLSWASTEVKCIT